MNQNPPTDLDLDEIASRAAHLYEYVNVDVEGAQPDFDKLTGTDVGVLLAEVRRLRARASELEVGLNDLAALVSQWHNRSEKAKARVTELEGTLTAIRHLHKDSPMGPCPVCIDADAVAEGRDGLMPYPCPTGRLAGAQDCDPPHVRAATAAPAVSGGEQ